MSCIKIPSNFVDIDPQRGFDLRQKTASWRPSGGTGTAIGDGSGLDFGGGLDDADRLFDR